jgi:hypothetical protein
MRRAPADLLHPNPAERDSKGYALQANQEKKFRTHAPRPVRPGRKRADGTFSRFPSETKDIEKALWARFWGYKGQIPLFWVCTFLQLKEEAMIRQRLVTLYTHQKLFASRRTLYHSHHISSFILLLQHELV